MSKEKIDYWFKGATIQPNAFKYKSLSNWSFNVAIGCGHACRFCYVPDVSTRRMASSLKEYQIQDPDAEWGQYLLLRQFDEPEFLRSLALAEKTPLSELKVDGNRAVMYCTTTDAYQVIHHPDPVKRKEMQAALEHMVRRSLELILYKSTLNVRILTRSPLAREHFDLYAKFRNRLLFGMSLPTMDNKLAKIYEPGAPSPSARLKTLQEAKAMGLHVYVAVAPTYPECDSSDLINTLMEIGRLKPVTVFHEPINIRAENVERIRKHAEALGVKTNTEVFKTPKAWADYAFESLYLVESIADKIGLSKQLHLWPDADLRRYADYQINLGESATQSGYRTLVHAWLNKWWNRISEWPTTADSFAQ